MILLLVRYIFFFVLGGIFMVSLFGAWPLSEQAVIAEREKLLVTDSLVQAYVAQNRHSSMVSSDRWLLEALTDTSLNEEAINSVKTKLELELFWEENWHCLMDAMGEERLPDQSLFPNSLGEDQSKTYQERKIYTIRMVVHGPAADQFELMRVSYDQGEARIRYGIFRVKNPQVPFFFCEEVEFETLLDINTPIDPDFASELYTTMRFRTSTLELPSDIEGRNSRRLCCFCASYNLEFTESINPNSFSYDRIFRLGPYADQTINSIYRKIETIIEEYIPNEQRVKMLGT